ncbi:S-layer homology domain-containing protein [Lysinibacillus odysseyi]|uniref:SLH domain-containing protein n=1 Tax=Lysinibacillus odysseyi 34hs-1 = NBRC 100172 TaxID=1220589 RepID=A0A0A3J9R4_9BACI|nr:S-layer homology domain-containing protein [Lysinibacillus odysseyi]KGR83757.1 hypothetical protein CD32_13705 [Lysinibacillus odysseyi 34hs-1 = NBRC 100172]
MGYQQKSYKKFVATAATATLVASAIVPVASAAGFKDVPADNEFAPFINALVDEGIINGYASDNTFRPSNKLTRGQVAIMLGRWLENNGEIVPADWNTVQRFNDVPVNATTASGKELAKYAALVKETGVFTGVLGSLNPGQNITRENMAVVLDRVATAVTGFSLVEVAEEIEDVTVADLDKAQAAYQDEIQALADLEITTVSNFRPKEQVSRAQFAKFLYTTFEVIEEILATPEVTVDTLQADIDAVAKALPTVESITTVENAEAAKTAVTTAKAELEKIKAAIEKADLTEEEVATLNKAITAVETTMNGLVSKADQVIEDAKTFAVSGVEAVNAKQVLVKFSHVVGTGAATEANYGVSTAASSVNNVVADAEVQADGKSVLLTLTDAYKVETDLVVTVDGIYKKDSIKEQIKRFSGVVTVNDTTAPTIKSIVSTTNTNAAQVVTVTFSEPLTALPTLKVNGAVATGTLSNNNTTVTITGLNLSADKAHTLEVLNLTDYADNNVVYTTQNFTVTKDASSATGKAAVVSDNKVQVTFDKAVNQASLANVDILRYDSATKSYTPVSFDSTTPYALDKTGKVATFYVADSEKTNFFGLNDSTENLIVKVKSGVLDTAGNQVTTFEQTVVANQDVTGPALDSITYDKNSKGEATKLYFHFNEELTTAATALVDGDIVVTDLATNTKVAFADVFGANNTVSVATDGKTLVVAPEAVASVTNKLKSGKYAFTVKPALVKDTAFAKNDNKEATKSVDFGAVANEVTVTGTTINAATDVDNKLTVTFSKPVTAASAINPANYSINGKALPIDTVISVNAAGTNATFTLPANTVEKSDGAAVLTITGIKAQDSSATFKTYVSAINALDNTAPTAKGSVLANGKIQVTFSEAVTAAAADFSSLTINGKVLATTGTAPTTVNAVPTTLVDGTSAVIIDVQAKTQDNSASTGFSYLYIDVDGDDTLDFTKDIVLSQVTGVPNAQWTAVADLNLVNTVEVVLPTTPATKDNSTLNNAQTGNTAGNKLAGGVIKVK